MQGEVNPESETVHDSQLLPESAPQLADWIESELGDTELAEFLRTHANEAPLFANGERLLPTTAFDLLDDLETLDAPKYKDVLNAMEQGKIFPELSPLHMVGDAPDEKKELVRVYQKREAARSIIALQDNERKVYHEEGVMIGVVLAHLNALRTACGLPELSFNQGALHAINQKVLDKFLVGAYSPMPQSVRVASPESAIRQLGAIAHELTHFASHAAIRVAYNEEQGVVAFGLHRLGLQTTVGTSPEDEISYLTNLNEAVTEETARKFLLGMPADDPEFGYITKLRQESIQQFFDAYGVEAEKQGETPDEIVDIEERADGAVRPRHFLYADERKLMYELLDKIYARNPKLFEGRSAGEAKEDLFGMLQKAMFTGNILPFGRLFNDTFGSGKFREFGRLQTTKAQEEFVAAL